MARLEELAKGAVAPRPRGSTSTPGIAKLKDISPDAVAVSDQEATKEASSRAADERRIVEMERRRLRLGCLPMPEQPQASE